MDPKEIRELIEIISRSSFSTFELEREGFRIKLVKAGGDAPVIVAAPAPREAAALDSAGQGSAAEPAAAVPATPAGEALHELRSPIVGTFYRAPSPDVAPFAEVGSQVRRGQVLCIVEAMKVMNEIESEVDAEVVDILVANGQPVEYGEVLFRLRPVS